jgi:hypothetical protein
MHRNIAAALLTAVLGGCGLLKQDPVIPPPKGGETVEITKQQNGRFVAFVSQRLQHSEPYLGVAGTNFFALRSWYDTKTGETAHQVYVSDSYHGGPYKWDGVHDLDKKALRFVAIGRHDITCEAGCSYFDEFAAVLPEDYLQAHKGGLALTFTARDGKSLAVAVPGNVVNEELIAVDTIRSSLAQANAAPAAAGPPAAPVAATAPAPTKPTAPASSPPEPGKVTPAPPPARATTTAPAASGR